MGSSGDVSRCVLARDSMKNMGAVRSDALEPNTEKAPVFENARKMGSVRLTNGER